MLLGYCFEDFGDLKGFVGLYLRKDLQELVSLRGVQESGYQNRLLEDLNQNEFINFGFSPH